MMENILCQEVRGFVGQGINLNTLLANAVLQEVLLHWILCDETVALTPDASTEGGVYGMAPVPISIREGC